jgi:hypothetical protein
VIVETTPRLIGVNTEAMFRAFRNRFSGFAASRKPLKRFGKTDEEGPKTTPINRGVISMRNEH